MSEGLTNTMSKDLIKNKFFAIFFVFILVNISYAFADSITTNAVFNVENYPPKIESINIEGDLIKIEISDPNGYKDIVNVKVFVKTIEKEAAFEHGEGVKTLYTARINNLDKERPFDLKVEVTDNDNKVNSNEKITGLTVSNDNGFGSSIINFFKRLFSFL